MTMPKARLLTLLACALAAGAQAQDRADMERAQIIGNRELPKVLYIVPWKKPLPGVLSGRPVASVLDEALAPVDREVFRRQVDYNTQLQQRAAPATPAVAPPSPAAPAPAPAVARRRPRPRADPARHPPSPHPIRLQVPSGVPS